VKSTGAFSYFTRTIVNAFIKRIKMEKIQMYVKQKYISECEDIFVDVQEHDEENFTEEMRDILQEMSGDEFKLYDIKTAEKQATLSDTESSA
jgi:hypothetical protein